MLASEHRPKETLLHLFAAMGEDRRTGQMPEEQDRILRLCSHIEQPTIDMTLEPGAQTVTAISFGEVDDAESSVELVTSKLDGGHRTRVVIREHFVDQRIDLVQFVGHTHRLSSRWVVCEVVGAEQLDESVLFSMTPDRVPIPAQLDTDQALRVLMQQIEDLAERVHFLERALLPGVPAPTRFDSARAKAARTAGESLRPDLESIGSALDSVMTSIESNRSRPTPPPVEDVVVDLSTGRRTSPRPDPNRQSGWQPVSTKKR